MHVFRQIYVFVCVCVCVYVFVCVIIMVYNVYNNNILCIKRAGGWRSRAYNHIIYYSVATRQRCWRLGRRRRRRRRQAGERARTYTRPLAIRHWWRARRGRRNIIGSGGGGGFSRFRASKARPGGGGVCGGAACGDRQWGRARLEYIPTTPNPRDPRLPATTGHTLARPGCPPPPIARGSWPWRRGVARRCVCGDSPCAPLAPLLICPKTFRVFVDRHADGSRPAELPSESRGPPRSTMNFSRKINKQINRSIQLASAPAHHPCVAIIL